MHTLVSRVNLNICISIISTLRHVYQAFSHRAFLFLQEKLYILQFGHKLNLTSLMYSCTPLTTVSVTKETLHSTTCICAWFIGLYIHRVHSSTVKGIPAGLWHKEHARTLLQQQTAPHMWCVFHPTWKYNKHSPGVSTSEGVYYWLIIAWIYLHSNNNVYMYRCIYTCSDEGCELFRL